ncbi:hypothetical protein DLJ57_19300 [Micromonospora chalcea]|nr:hypothetical protein DLJ57_19300 [Micromonospora chalcea]
MSTGSPRVLPAERGIDEAAAVLRAGGLVAFPTETVYGLGANALDARAAARIFEAKARPSFDPLISHLADAADLAALVGEVPAAVAELAKRFWPGPLTLIVDRPEIIPPIVTSGLDTMAVRVPDGPSARALIAAAGVPVRPQVGTLSLGALAAAYADCALVVSNDTGPLHLAAAVGAPTVGVFWVGNLINGASPLRGRHRPIAAWTTHCPVCGVDCTPGIYPHRPGDGECPHRVSFVADVPAAEVIEAARELLTPPPSTR